MKKTSITLTDKEIGELEMIILDRDGEEALLFLREKVLSQITAKEKKKMQVDGKSHL